MHTSSNKEEGRFNVATRFTSWPKESASLEFNNHRAKNMKNFLAERRID